MRQLIAVGGIAESSAAAASGHEIAVAAADVVKSLGVNRGIFPTYAPLLLGMRLAVGGITPSRGRALSGSRAS